MQQLVAIVREQQVLAANLLDFLVLLRGQPQLLYITQGQAFALLPSTIGRRSGWSMEVWSHCTDVFVDYQGNGESL